MKADWMGVLGAMLCAMALCAGATGQNDEAERWAGRGIRLSKTASGASIEFDCAHGNIAQPITPDAAGEFSVAGTYTPEMGGPVRRDNPPRDLPATYKGTINRDTMHLEVVLQDKDRQPPPFTLTLGGAGKVVKCR